MHKVAVRYVRRALAAPFVFLAIVFDWASAMMQGVAERIAPKDKPNGAH